MKKYIAFVGLLVGIILINLLFVAKYGTRLDLAFPAGMAYIFFIAILTLAFHKLTHAIPTWIPIGLVLLFCCFAFVVLHRIKPLSINVDRWSAMANFDAALLHGDYPYLVETHLGGVMSCLPVMYISGLPFYLLGDVGYYQIFSLLLFSLLVYGLIANNNTRTYILLLLMTSPVFIYEVIVRSDLFTNMVLFMGIIFIAEKYKNRKNTKRMMLLGALIGLIALTRSIVGLLFLLYFIRYFDFKKEIRSAVVFLSSAAAIFLGILAVFYFWSPVDFVAHIPFSHQKGFIPNSILALFVFAASLAGVFVTSLKRFVWSAGFLMLALISVLFILAIQRMGMQNTLYKHMFDISYFSFSMPYLILGIGFVIEEIPSGQFRAVPMQ
ncbi:MAG: hypothetical protein ABSG67_06020 [Thermoguttaceae bacterium]|jgi:hypothetical protein